MRPATLREACERARTGQPWSIAIGELLQAFYTAESTAARTLLAEAPERFDDSRLGALAGTIAEYLYKRWTRADPPGWMSERSRYLAEPWFVTASTDPGLRESLTLASPPEFESLNIMTDEAPLRRATARVDV